MTAIAPLFGNPHKATSSKPLVEFRAGKMTMEIGTSMVIPDKRKGLVQIQKTKDRLMHLVWQDRVTGEIEDDLIIFPHEIEFTRVTQCTTGRVYVLKFKSSSRRMFFWMQEPKTNRDDDFCRKVNAFFNNPPIEEHELDLPRLRRINAGINAGSTQMEEDEMDSSDTDYMPTQDLDDLPEDERNQVLSFISSADPVTGERDRSILNASSNIGNSQRPTTSARPGPVQLADLQNLLSNYVLPKPVKKEYPTNLCLGITKETIDPLLKKPEFLEKMKQHLPDVKCDVANEVSSTISTPQFQQALALFSSGIESGQLGSVMKEFGFGSSVVAAAVSGEMDLFIKALQEEEKKKASSSQENEDVDMKE